MIARVIMMLPYMGMFLVLKNFSLVPSMTKIKNTKKKFEVLHLNTCADFLDSLQWLHSTAMVPSYPQHFPMEISAIYDSSAHMYVSFSYPDTDLEFSSCISTLKWCKSINVKISQTNVFMGKNSQSTVWVRSVKEWAPPPTLPMCLHMCSRLENGQKTAASVYCRS